MLFVVIGVLIIAMNLIGFGPVATWNWDITGDLWKFCVPFLLAFIWWIWTDKSGLDKRREMQKMEDRKENRRRENLERMGLNFRSYGKNKKQEKAILTARQREIERIEGKRTEKRKKIRDSILGSRFNSQTPGQSGFPDDKGKR